MPTRDDCLQLDARDTLAPLREAFELPAGVVYLNGHSLGPLPRGATARALEVVRKAWDEGLIRSGNDPHGLALPRRQGDRLAPLIGAGAGEVLMTDTPSATLFKLLAALLPLQRGRDVRRRVIVAQRSNFSSDVHDAQGLAHLVQQGHALRLVDGPEDIPAALGPDTAVLMLAQVDNRSGVMHDMTALTRRAHDAGALALWDLAHATGALQVDLAGADADAAVGCTCKYLNGGPLAPAFLWLAPRWHGEFESPLSGWWGHAEPFAMEPPYRAGHGIGHFVYGTQALLSQTLLACALEVLGRTDMAAVRKKSLALTDLFIALVEQHCTAHPLTLLTPREHARRASQVSWQHPAGRAVMQALTGRGVIGDGREPGLLRFGFTPLYTRFIDVWDAAQALREVLDSQEWQDDGFQKRAALT